MSSRIAVMDKGRIVQVGTPNEIYEFPTTRYVADFIGSVNLFEGRLVKDEPDHCIIDSDEAGCSFHVGHGVSGAPGAVLWIALRPEKIRMTRPDGPLGVNEMDGVIKEIAYLGDISIYHVRVTGGKTVKVTLPNLSRGAAREFTWEDAVRLCWADDAGVVLQQ